MKPEDKKEKPAAKKAASANGKVFDVSRPGKTPASPTSKPVILGHKPEAQASQAAVSGVGETRPLLVRRKIEITPTGDVQVEKAEAKTPETAVPPQVEMSKTNEVVPLPAPEPKPAPETPAQPTEAEKEALAAAALDAVTGAPDVPEAGKGVLSHDAKVKIEPPAEAAPEPKAEAEPAPAPEAEKPTEAQPSAPGAEAKPEPEPESQDTQPDTTTKPEETPAETPSDEPVEKETMQLEKSSVPDEATTDDAAKPAEGADGATGEQEGEAAPEPVIQPLFDDSGKIIVSQHHHQRHHGIKVAALLLLILILAAAALNIALDLEVLNLEGIPHTDFL